VKENSAQGGGRGPVVSGELQVPKLCTHVVYVCVCMCVCCGVYVCACVWVCGCGVCGVWYVCVWIDFFLLNTYYAVKG